MILCAHLGPEAIRRPPRYWSPGACTASYEVVRPGYGLRSEKRASEGQTKATGVVQASIRGDPARNSPRHHGFEACGAIPRSGLGCHSEDRSIFLPTGRELSASRGSRAVTTRLGGEQLGGGVGGWRRGRRRWRRKRQTPARHQVHQGGSPRLARAPSSPWWLDMQRACFLSPF